MWKIRWGDTQGEEITTSSCKEVLKTVKDLHCQFEGTKSGRWVQICDARGSTLMIGIGQPRSPLVFLETEKYISYNSVGDLEEFQGNDVIEFYMGSHHSPVSVEATVPLDDAWEAVRYFCHTGKPAPHIHWVIS